MAYVYIPKLLQCGLVVIVIVFITEVLAPCIIDCLTPFKLIPIKVSIHTGYQVMNNKNIQNIKSNKSVIIATWDLQHLIGILQGINSLLTMKRFMEDKRYLSQTFWYCNDMAEGWVTWWLWHLCRYLYIRMIIVWECI